MKLRNLAALAGFHIVPLIAEELRPRLSAVPRGSTAGRRECLTPSSPRGLGASQATRRAPSPCSDNQKHDGGNNAPVSPHCRAGPGRNPPSNSPGSLMEAAPRGLWPYRQGFI